MTHVQRGRQCDKKTRGWKTPTTLNLLFCWLNKLPVTAAADAAGCARCTAVDAYSMAREVCEVIMSHEVLTRRFSGPGIEVEVDECFLTRQKYHKGWKMRTSTVMLFGIHERATNLGFHLQVRARSQAVLLSEIQRFIELGHASSQMAWRHTMGCRNTATCTTKNSLTLKTRPSTPKTSKSAAAGRSPPSRAISQIILSIRTVPSTHTGVHKFSSPCHV